MNPQDEALMAPTKTPHRDADRQQCSVATRILERLRLIASVESIRLNRLVDELLEAPTERRYQRALTRARELGGDG